MTIGCGTRGILGSNCIRARENGTVWFVLRDFFLNYFVLMRERLKQECFRFDACNSTHRLFA